jgi:pimeloyl-ACP methyl ester carboxylesterase
MSDIQAGPTRDRVPHPRRSRRLIAVVVSVAAVLALVIGLRQPAPVGHFISADAKDRFVTAYATAMADLPRPERTLDLRTSFGVVRVYRFSGADPDAAPPVLLPGRASASPVWADNLPALLEQRSAYALDLLGEPGLSIQDRPIASDADQAKWLSEVLAQLPEPRFHLLGVSIGGWTALNLVVHADAKIASVTLLDPVFVFAPMSNEAILRSIPASVRWFPKAWRDDFASWTAGGAPVQDVPLAQLIETGFQTYALKLPAPTQPSEPTLATVDCPVLVIMAGQSPMHDSAAAAETARRSLSKGTVLSYPDASHAINGEYPQEIAADLVAFLAGLG